MERNQGTDEKLLAHAEMWQEWRHHPAVVCEKCDAECGWDENEREEEAEVMAPRIATAMRSEQRLGETTAVAPCCECESALAGAMMSVDGRAELTVSPAYCSVR